MELYRGDSFTLGIKFNDEYNIERIQELELNIGSILCGKLSDDSIAKDANGVFVCKIPSEETMSFYGGKYKVTLHVQDEVLGVKKQEIGKIDVKSSNNKTNNESINTLYDVLFVVAINETQVTVEHTFRDIIKGDPLLFSDLTPMQIAELQRPATEAILSIQAVESAVSGNEGLRVQAELKRQLDTSTAISNAEKATDDANEKAELANNAALLANEKAGLAETATTQANDARDGANTAATNADNARLAIQGDLNGKVNTTDIEQVRSQATNKVASSKLLDDELTALENTVDAVTADTLGNTADIRLLENVINSANINQETTATATGVDTVLLPKTAANTGMKVQLFGQSAENLVVNGDFRNGTTGWSNYSAGTSVLENGYMKYTPITVVGAISNGFKQLSVGNKWYVRTIIKSSSTVTVSVGFAKSGVGTLLATGNIGTSDTTVSGILTIANADINEFVVGRPNVIQDIYIKKASAINLTATFGAGNEPTKEQCDLLFANYFEGSDNVLGTGRIRSVNSAGLLPSYLYFNGGQLRSNRLIKDEIRKGTNGYELVKRVGVGSSNGEIVINGGFDSTESWTIQGGTSNISGGILKLIADAGVASNATQPKTIIAGRIYRYSLNITPNLGTVYLYIGSNSVRSFRTSHRTGLITGFFTAPTNGTFIRFIKESSIATNMEFDNLSIIEYNPAEGAATAGGEVVFGNSVHYTLSNPKITPISYAGLLNSNSNGTAYFEPIIADAGVYGSNLSVQLTDYPIASFESIRKYANGTYTELNTATAVIASGGLSFTHPDLASDDLVMFTYAYNKESIGRSMTLTHYDSRYVKADTANGKTYRIVPVVTNGVVSWTTVEV